MISWSIASEIHDVGCLAAQVKGARVYSRLKFESGVHRVQRVRLGSTHAQPSNMQAWFMLLCPFVQSGARALTAVRRVSSSPALA